MRFETGDVTIAQLDDTVLLKVRAHGAELSPAEALSLGALLTRVAIETHLAVVERHLGQLARRIDTGPDDANPVRVHTLSDDCGCPPGTHEEAAAMIKAYDAETALQSQWGKLCPTCASPLPCRRCGRTE